MRDSDRMSLENAIMTRIKRLDIILDTVNRDTADKIDQKYDESARLDNLNHAPVDAALVDHARLERARLKDNLGWINEVDAGLCEVCASEIPIQRLLAVPTTRKCVKCAGKD